MASGGSKSGRRESRDTDRSPTAQDLVRERNGELDWNTLGNILTAHILGEVACAAYVDFKYGRWSSEFRADTDWQFAYEEHDLLILKKRLDSSPRMCSFMGRGVIDLPMTEIARFISDIEMTYTWDKFLTEARCVRMLSESEIHRDYIGYFCHETRRCWIRSTCTRDLVTYVRGIYKEGKYIQSAISVDCTECPLVPRVTRAQCCLGSGWVLEPCEGNSAKTLVSYVVNVDLRVPLPRVVMNRVLSQLPLTIHYLREHLMEGAHRSAQLTEDSHCSSQFIGASTRQYEEAASVDDFMHTRRQRSQYSVSSTVIETSESSLEGHSINP